MQTPAGVTTTAQANAFLAQSDPCNTKAFPAEEFWTYSATAVTPVLTTYDCTRKLRPQADFVTPDVDLVLYTMGGNDAGFSTIVTNCFVPLRNASGCKTSIDAARAALPPIRGGLLTGIAAFRAHGLRNDAKIVQLGYPLLQTDNNFTLTGPRTYDAGNQVRAFGQPGQRRHRGCRAGRQRRPPGPADVPHRGAGEVRRPRARRDHADRQPRPVGQPGRRPGAGRQRLVPPQPARPDRVRRPAHRTRHVRRTDRTAAPPAPPAPRVTARLKATFRPHQVRAGDRVRLTVKVRLSDGSRAHGKVLVKGPGRGNLATAKIHRGDHGKAVLTFRVPGTKASKLRVVYRDKVAPTVRKTHRVRAR